jgi:hypothetical protein
LFAFVLASLMISSLTQRYLGHVGSGTNVDFYVYYFAAQAVHDNPHANIYTGATNVNPEISSAPAGSEILAHAKAAGFEDVEFYVYPPLLADLLVPLSQVSPHLAAVLWRAINLTLAFVSVLLLSRVVKVPILSFEFAVLTLAAFSFWPIHEAISDGQIAIVMLALWTAGVVAYFDDRTIFSAAAFALATTLKVTPIFLLPLFFLWRDRRWIVSYLAITFGLVAAMVAINGLPTVSAYPAVISAMAGCTPALGNKSIGSLIAWVYYGRIFSLSTVHEVMVNPPRVLSIIAKTISLAFYLSTLFLVWRSRRALNRARRAEAIAVFGLVTLCFSPVSWRHGYAVALLALAVFWAKALRTPPRVLHAVLLTMTTFTLGSLFFDLAAQTSLPQILRIALASSWIVFSVLFCLEALYHTGTVNRVGASEDRDFGSSPEPPELDILGSSADPRVVFD